MGPAIAYIAYLLVLLPMAFLGWGMMVAGVDFLLDYAEMQDPDKHVMPRGIALSLAAMYQLWALACVFIVGGMALGQLTGLGRV